MIGQINAFCLFVDDAKKSEQFYAKKVGLKVKSRDQGFVEFTLGETELACLERGAASDMLKGMAVSPKSEDVSFTIAAYVDDVDVTYAELKKRGVKFVVPPVLQPWGQKTANFRDPDGYLWEISCFVESESE